LLARNQELTRDQLEERTKAMTAMTRLPPGIHFLSPTIPVFVFEAAESGPTAIVQAGIHGNEVAGVHALSELLEGGAQPERGRLLLIPVMNPAAYRARQRAAPGGLDMNRCFPGDANAPEVEKRLARQFMDLVESERPALVATLHESMKRHHPAIPQSFGQTIVYGVQPMPPVLDQVIERLNRELVSPYELWATHYYPVATSSTEVIVDKVGCLGVCVETWEAFEERRRIDMQRSAVHALLDAVGVGLRVA
jgi:uncharacterized protein